MDWTELDYHFINEKIEKKFNQLQIIAENNKKGDDFIKHIGNIFYAKINDQLFIMEAIKDLKIKLTDLETSLKVKQEDYLKHVGQSITEAIKGDNPENWQLPNDAQKEKTRILEKEIDTLQSDIQKVKSKITDIQRQNDLGLWD